MESGFFKRIDKVFDEISLLIVSVSLIALFVGGVLLFRYAVRSWRGES